MTERSDPPHRTTPHATVITLSYELPGDKRPSPGKLARTEWLAVLVSCLAASLAAQFWSWRHHAMLNFGDAIAHLHIARRIFDSRHPGLVQLGSVWLPLPHLLMVPFVQVYAWWANGIAGAIPSALAYLVACLGLYRLARHWLPPATAAVTLVFFALNPNLLYLQTTAMTEPLFLCEVIWIALWLVEWRISLDADAAKARCLLWCITALLIAAVFTRYDGWVMAFLAWLAMAVTLARRGRLRTPSFWMASVLLAAAPTAWFLYNAKFFGDWLYFARGPYSAAAIEKRTAAPGTQLYPGWHNPWVALLFFLKVSEMDAAAAAWGNLMLVLSVLGTAYAWFRARRRAFAYALLLWIPIPFYAFAVAYASVPIFIPPWWPHSYYNTRYGMEMLPGFALGVGLVAQLAVAAVCQFKPAGEWRKPVLATLFVLVGLNFLLILRERPLVYVEGTWNAQARRPYDQHIPPVLRSLLAARPGGLILMNTSRYPEIVSLTGIPLRQTINNNDKQLFAAALANPAAHAAIVLAFHGGSVARAVKAHPEGLKEICRFTAQGQPAATIYISDASPVPPTRAPQQAAASGVSIGLKPVVAHREHRKTRIGNRVQSTARPNIRTSEAD